MHQALQILCLIDEDNSDLDVSDNDNPILDITYQPAPQEEGSSEDEGGSSDDEEPIPELTELSRGRARRRGADNG